MKDAFKSYDLLGKIAILKFSYEVSFKERKKFAEKFLKENKNVKTVLEKTGKFKGRLRKMETRFLAGVDTKEVLYKENDCVFRFNVDNTYFSPRLSNERKEIADLIAKDKRKEKNVLVMFAGVAPFSIVIARRCKNCRVYSNEINREANKYAKLNIELNNLKNRVELISGDVKKISKKINKKFNFIIMPRPQLKDSFLKEAFALSKKGTKIFYYDFCRAEDKELIVTKIKDEARISRRRIKILSKKVAGEVGPYRVRLRIDFRVL